MVTDEMLKKLKDYALKVVNEDARRGVTVTLAMEPVTVYLITRELLIRREKEPWALANWRVSWLMEIQAMNDSTEARVYTIHWSDLGKYLKRGMQVITVMPGPGAETSMLAIVPDELVADLEKHSKSRRKTSLREILIDMAGWASFKPGDVRRAKLAGGLGIDVIWGIDGMWRLQIWREGAQPSLKEWETVLKSWPEPLPEVPYKRFTHNNRQYLRGEWKVTNEQVSGDLPGGIDGATEAPAGPDGPDREVQQPE